MAKNTGSKKTTQSPTAKSASDKKYLSNGMEKAELTKKQSPKGKQKTLKDLFEDGLKDILSAEKQLVEALPKVVNAAYSEDLQHAVEYHLEQTQRQVQRLEKIMAHLKVEPGDKECEAMKGLVKEADEIIKNFPEGPVRDSALIIGAQKVEHYEIATYGSLCELADVLGMHKIHDTLGLSLDEEEQTDTDLSDLAKDINDEAFEMQQDSSEEDEEENNDNQTSKSKKAMGKKSK